MPERKYHLQEQAIPEGFQIFEERLDVMGIKHQREAALAFVENTSDAWLEFERDEDNAYDKNAIKVVGCNNDSRYFLGYVPKEVSKLVIDGGFFDEVKPRLLKTYIGYQNFVEILFQIIGPSGKKYQYRQTENVEGTRYTDYIDRVKQLAQDKRHPEVIELLLKLIEWVDKDQHSRWTWYHNQLAVVYRKEKRYQDEIDLLEKYINMPRSKKESKESKIWLDEPIKRLEKARELLSKIPKP